MLAEACKDATLSASETKAHSGRTLFWTVADCSDQMAVSAAVFLCLCLRQLLPELNTTPNFLPAGGETQEWRMNTEKEITNRSIEEAFYSIFNKFIGFPCIFAIWNNKLTSTASSSWPWSLAGLSPSPICMGPTVEGNWCGTGQNAH